MKFYDKGFIDIYDNYVDLQIFNSGILALHLTVYKDRVCKTTFKCISSKEFNSKYFTSKYEDNFLYTLLKKDKIYYKNKKDKIFIKVIK
jgi:hypothetical protein